jgi:hypothetical protein
VGAVVVCLLGQAAAFTHLALVRHATCPEHEDALVHGTDAAATTGPPGPVELPAGATATGYLAVPLPTGGEGHDDDHCVVAAFRRSNLATPAPEAGQGLPTSDELLSPPAQARHGRPGPVPLLRLAPKISPPFARA